MRTSLGTSARPLLRTLLRTLAPLLTLTLAVPATTTAYAASTPAVGETTVVDADQSFRGLDAVDRDTAWIAGGSVSGGTGGVFVTTDGGETWTDVRPPQTDGLNFRDVEATSDRVAQVLAIGTGEDSRIFRTTDGGATWTETFRNLEETAFYNCLDFYPGGRVGLAVSDPVDGEFRIARTTDSGASWQVLDEAAMPASDGEFNFSASGECLAIAGGTAYFGSGGAAARVYSSRDRGLTWTATQATVPSSETGGVLALVFRGRGKGLLSAGDFVTPTQGTTATRHRRGWRPAGALTHLGEDVAWLTGRSAITTGEGGADLGTSWTRDRGRTWTRISEEGFHTLDCVPGGTCWAAGGGGRVALIN